MSNLAKTLREIRKRSDIAPRGYLVANRDQLDALRESPDDVRTLLAIVDVVFAEISEGISIDAVGLLHSMEQAVTPDIVLTEQKA